MTVRAPCHAGEAQGGNLAMHCIAVSSNRFLVAGAALLDHLQLPRFRIDACDLMSRMTIRAHRGFLIPRLHGATMYALDKAGQNSGVTGTAGRRDIFPIHHGVGLIPWLDFVRAVTTGTIGRYQKG